MKTKELKNKLITLGTVISKNPAIPVLEYIILENETLRASNLFTEVIVPAPRFKGTALFPYYLLKKTIEKLNVESDITLVAIKEKSSGIKVDGKVKFTFNELDSVEEFPVKREIKGKSDRYAIDRQDMKTIKRAFKFTYTEDELRPAMTCICINNEHIAATDAHQLFFKKHNLYDEGKEDILISINVAAAFNKLGDGIMLEVFEETIRFYDSETEISTRRIDEKYPDYKNVIPDPDTRTTKLMVKRQELINILQQADICAHSTTHQVILVASGNKLTVTSKDKDFATNFKDQIPVISKNKFRAGFNAQFFIKILKEFDQDTITIESNGKNSSAIVISNEHLLMPVMIDDYSE